MSNSILTRYQDHQAAVALHNGGESADWPEIANTLAQVYLDRLGELPLERRLKYAWAYPVRQPNGQWPNLVIVHGGSLAMDVDQCWTEWTHRAQVILICGPWGSDPARMQELGAPYLWPMKAVADANQSLDGRCKSIRVDPQGALWGALTYGTSPSGGGLARWYGLSLQLLIYGQTLRLRGV